MKVVIATSNQGKLKEFETLLAPLNWQFYSLQDLGIDSPIEDGATFYENALIKAKHAATISGFPAIADDSGLCVDSLRGAPGIKSARYAGEKSSDADNNLKLLESLENETQRNAAFVACLVFFDPNSDKLGFGSVTASNENFLSETGASSFSDALTKANTATTAGKKYYFSYDVFWQPALFFPEDY